MRSAVHVASQQLGGGTRGVSGGWGRRHRAVARALGPARLRHPQAHLLRRARARRQQAPPLRVS
jgi:hypothetical protein